MFSHLTTLLTNYTTFWIPMTRYIASHRIETLHNDINYGSYYVLPVPIKTSVAIMASLASKQLNSKQWRQKPLKKWRIISIINNISKCLRETVGVFIIIYRKTTQHTVERISKLDWETDNSMLLAKEKNSIYFVNRTKPDSSTLFFALA